MAATAQKMKILVTGASGFIGQEVSRQLSSDGFRPRLMMRELCDSRGLCHFDADFVLGDLRDRASLRRAVKGVDGVIHLGARATFESYKTLRPSILDGSLALMEAAAATGVRCFVYSSSLLVYSENTSNVDANTPVRPVLDYGRIKVDTEKRLAQMAAAAGIAFTALRLPHVYGAQDLYFQQLRAGRLVLPGRGHNRYTHLHVADAAAALIACAQHEFAGITPVGDRLPSTWTAFLQVVRQHVPEARVLVLPKWLALLAAFLVTPLRRFRPYPGLETPGAVRSYNFNIAVKPDLLWKDLGLSLRYPTIHEGVPAVAAESETMRPSAGG
jgi:nucleoside-diphosphate-sugar epimerase